MAITVKHTKVSTIPDGDDATLIRPSDWNDDHQLTGTVPVNNGGTGAATLTGYVKGNGTSAMTAAATIPSTDITGLGTMSTQNANNVTITGGSISGATVSGYIPTTEKGVANGVATLDSGGKVPVSQIPALGDLNYQGTWNASTNTPTLTSSTGTKGYYYVVSVAGSTNLNGITDWQIGDWAVFNGSIWQKIDNTDAVTSVNGYTGTVNLTYTDVGAFPATGTTGSGNVVLATGAMQANPTISNYENFTSTTAPAYSEGRVWYDSTEKALAFYNDSSALSVHVAQDLIVKVINNTGSTIANGSPVYITSTSSGQTYPNVALARADVASTSAVIGLTNGAIANGAIGYVSAQGIIDNVNTSTYTVGQVLYLSPYSAGQLMNTIPPTGITVQVGVVSYVNSSTGKIYVKQTTPLAVPASIITGTLGVDHGGTGATTLTGYVKGSGTSALTASSTIPTTDLSGTVTNAQLANSAITINGTSTSLGGSIGVGTVTSVAATAGTGISVTGSPITSSGTLNITNTAPDQTVVLTAGTGISTSGTYPNFTITNTSPSSGGTVTSITAGTGLSGGTITSSGTIAIDSTVATLTGAQTLTNKTISGASNTLTNIGNSSLTNSAITINGTSTSLGGSISVGTVTSVTGTSPIVSSGGNTPAISMPAATSSVNGYLTSADWTTFNNKGSGTVTSVTGTAPVVSSGGATPAISMAAATGSVNGYLTSTDWTTFNSKAASFTYTSTYIPYGQGTTTPNQTSNFTFDGTTQTAPVQRASNGIVTNSKTVSASYTIPSTDNAMSAGPVTVASGQTVTVSNGSRWVVL
jgi:hypothetical protein